jgi:hypothetical protein
MLKAFLFSFLLFSIHLQAQEPTPYDPLGQTETWAIKGKILPWPGPAAGMAGINSLIGFEYSFKKRHSLGIDLYFNRWHLDEDRYDSISKEYVSKYATRNRDKAVFLNYRYYLTASHLREHRQRIPYFGAFARLGYLHTYYDKGYVTTTLYQNEIHYSAGLLFGLLVSGGQKKISGDFNFGLFYKRKDITDSELVNQVNTINKYTSYNVGIRLGLNLYLWYSRK